MGDPVEVVMGLLEEVQGRIATQGLENLSSTELTLFSVYELISEVENGGFIQYLENSSGDRAHQALAGLRHIGAPESAAILERVIARLGSGAAVPERSARFVVLQQLGEQEWHAIEAENDAFYGQPEPLWALLAEYCRKHRDQLDVRESP